MGDRLGVRDAPHDDTVVARVRIGADGQGHGSTLRGDDDVADVPVLRLGHAKHHAKHSVARTGVADVADDAVGNGEQIATSRPGEECLSGSRARRQSWLPRDVDGPTSDTGDVRSRLGGSPTGRFCGSLRLTVGACAAASKLSVANPAPDAVAAVGKASNAVPIIATPHDRIETISTHPRGIEPGTSRTTVRRHP